MMEVLPNCYIFLFTVAAWFQHAWTSRKYDIEAECQKLYKEDLATVLARFRRTPEYLRIITDKNNELQLAVEDILRQTLFYWYEKVDDAVEERLALHREDAAIPSAAAAAGGKDPLCRKRFPLDMSLGRWPPRPAGVPSPRDVRKALRGDSGETTTRSGVDLLDGYAQLHTHLTISQKNAMKNLGFELAGNAIHAIIAALRDGADDGARSTRHPSGGDNDVTTTSHVTKHEVTTPCVTSEASDVGDAVRSGGGGGVTPFSAVSGGSGGTADGAERGAGDKQQHRMKIKNPRDETKRRTSADGLGLGNSTKQNNNFI